jgi:hypothetical protein
MVEFHPPAGTEEVERAFFDGLAAYQPPKVRKVSRRGKWRCMTPTQRYHARQGWLRKQAALRAKAKGSSASS